MKDSFTQAPPRGRRREVSDNVAQKTRSEKFPISRPADRSPKRSRGLKRDEGVGGQPTPARSDDREPSPLEQRLLLLGAVWKASATVRDDDVRRAVDELDRADRDDPPDPTETSGSQ